MTEERTGAMKGKPKVTIRQMEIDDIPSVYHLGERVFTSEDLPILYRTWDPYEVTEYFSSDPEYCFIAETGGKVVGFLLGTTIEKEGTAWKRYGYLSWMGVDEEYQRTKLGFRLYRRFEDRLKEDGVRMVMADTEGGNEEALAFFTELGFSVRGEHVWLAKTMRPRAKKDATNVQASPSTSPRRKHRA
ncbi:MAG: GNAT family N-acetyltransferase [Chloroflexota bacterium]|nr:GNAT family N-acetyltransferase [Chloroflexota bacterium]